MTIHVCNSKMPLFCHVKKKGENEYFYFVEFLHDYKNHFVMHGQKVPFLTVFLDSK